MLLQPAIGFHDFGRIGRGGEDLRDQRVRVQGDRRDELVQLFRRRLRGLAGRGDGPRCRKRGWRWGVLSRFGGAPPGRRPPTEGNR